MSKKLFLSERCLVMTCIVGPRRHRGEVPRFFHVPLCRSFSGLRAWVLCRGRLPSPRAWRRWCQKSLPPRLPASARSFLEWNSHLNTEKQTRSLVGCPACVTQECVIPGAGSLILKQLMTLMCLPGEWSQGRMGHIGNMHNVLSSTRGKTIPARAVFWGGFASSRGRKVSGRPSPRLRKV